MRYIFPGGGGGRTFRSLDVSYPGRFAPRLDNSHPELWTFRTQSLYVSYLRAGRFVPENVFFSIVYLIFWNQKWITNRPKLNRLNKSYSCGCENTKSSTEKKALGTKRQALGYKSSKLWVRNIQPAGYESSNLCTNRLGYETSRVRDVHNSFPGPFLKIA